MTYQQYRAVRRLVHSCCNYQDGNCLLLDDGEECVCPQAISYSLICRWFRAAVLPLDESLCAALLYRENMKKWGYRQCRCFQRVCDRFRSMAHIREAGRIPAPGTSPLRTPPQSFSPPRFAPYLAQKMFCPSQAVRPKGSGLAYSSRKSSQKCPQSS